MRILLFILFALTTSGQSLITPSRKSLFQKTKQHDPFSSHSIKTPLRLSKTSLTAVPIGTINSFYINFPFLAAFVTCGIKASVADIIAQKRQKKKENENDLSAYKEASTKRLEYQRNIAYILYGGFYLGIAQEYIFNHLFPIWFGSGTGMKNVLKKVLFDTLVVSPFLCLPTAYLFKALVFKYSPKEGLRRYKDDVLHHGLLKKCWSLWIPVQCLTFSVVPTHLRITFIALVSFFWLIILSSISTN